MTPVRRTDPARTEPPARLVVATRNPGKLAEIAAVLTDLELHTLAEFPGAPEVAETGETYAENARLKAESALFATGIAALGDDTGLEVDALDGRPGLHSAHYAGPERDSAANCARLLAELADVPDERRTARFRCLLVLAEPAATSPMERGIVPDPEDPLAHLDLAPTVDVRIFEGVVEGRIARTPRGASGFGYDPIFVVGDTGRTMAELTPAEKNTLSHRGRALAALRADLAARRVPGRP